MRIKTLIITLVAFFLAIVIGLGIFIFCYSKKEKEPESPKSEVEKPQESEPAPVVVEYWSDFLEDLPEPEENVVTISTAGQLAMLAKNVNEGNSYAGYIIRLANSINLLNREWTPIGYGNPWGGTPIFEGVFDGCDFTISNLKITKFAKGGSVLVNGVPVGSAGVGLFGCVSSGTVKNVKIDSAVIEGNHYTSVLVGYSNSGTISDCKVLKANVNCVYLNDDESGDKAGIICGYAMGGNIERCSAENCVVKADRNAGQLIGHVASSTVTDCEAIQVSVEWNHSSEGVEGYTKGGVGIVQELVGK